MRHNIFNSDDDNDNSSPRNFEYEFVHRRPPPRNSSSRTTQPRRRPTVTLLSSSDSDDSKLAIPDMHTFKRAAGTRRYAEKGKDGSAKAYEEIIDPEDTRVNAEAMRGIMEEYHQMEKDRHKHKERMGVQKLYANKDYLEYRRQRDLEEYERAKALEQQRLEQEQRRRERERREEMEFAAFERRVDLAFDRAKKARKDKVLAATPDLFAQLLNELSITSDNLRGCGYYQGFCPSRASLYNNYIYSVLFYGVNRVTQKPNIKDKIIAYYMTKEPETIVLQAPGMTVYSRINEMRERKMCIVDVLGYPQIKKKSCCEKLCEI